MTIFWWYQVTLQGHTVKRVECEGCGRSYVYRLERDALGVSTYPIRPRKAKLDATADAEKQLQKTLRDEIDIVPCPECGHFQEPMVRLSKRNHLRGLLAAGVWLTIAGPFFAAINDATGISDPRDQLVSWPLCATLAAIGPVLLIVRAVLKSRYDPNDEAPETRIKEGRMRALPESEYERLLREAEGQGG